MIHQNSMDAYEEWVASGKKSTMRKRLFHFFCSHHPAAFTDWEVTKMLRYKNTRGTQPSITVAIQDGLLKEVGNRFCTAEPGPVKVREVTNAKPWESYFPASEGRTHKAKLLRKRKRGLVKCLPTEPGYHFFGECHGATPKVVLVVETMGQLYAKVNGNAQKVEEIGGYWTEKLPTPKYVK